MHVSDISSLDGLKFMGNVVKVREPSFKIFDYFGKWHRLYDSGYVIFIGKK